MKHGQNHVTSAQMRKKSITLNCGDKKLTDDTFKNDCDINYIMQKYQKTGILPSTAQKLGQYLDVSAVPDLQEAYAVIMEAETLFAELPSQLRKRLDNDPRKLEDYLSDPDNRDELVKLGVMQQKNANDQTNANQAAQTQKNESEPQV